jgi:hypothetical protein
MPAWKARTAPTPASILHSCGWQRVRAANPRTAIVVNVGHAFDAGFARDAAALLVAWYPGQNFGKALVDVLSGRREPGGRLPMTLAAQEADYPAFDLTPDAEGNLAYAEGVLVGYRGMKAKGTTALFPLGAGQGYTRFALANARVEGGQVLVDVTNTGTRAGSEVVQAYLAQSPLPWSALPSCTCPPARRRRRRSSPAPISCAAWPAPARCRWCWGAMPRMPRSRWNCHADALGRSRTGKGPESPLGFPGLLLGRPAGRLPTQKKAPSGFPAGP